MKKLTLLKALFLLFALIAGTSASWADVTTTYTFSNRDWNATSGGESANWTVGLRGAGFTSGQGVQITTSADGANATSPVSFTNVKSIVVHYCTNKNKGAGSIKVKVGSGTEQSFSVTAPSSGGTTLKTKEFTFSPNETGAVTITVDCSTNSIYIHSIDITTSEAAKPVINADNVSIGHKTTAGAIDYSIDHEVTGGELTATCTSGSAWLTVGTVTSENVPFTTSVNEGNDERIATVRLTYTYETSKTVTKDVTVTQKGVLETQWVVTDLADLTSGDVFVIVGTKEAGSFAISNDKGTTAAPAAVAVTVADSKITSNVTDNIKWNISGNATNGYTFYPNGDDEEWLYCTNTNDGVRVGTSDNKSFSIDEGYLFNNGTSRYLGVYLTQDWRCYTSIGANIKDQTFAFYKKIVITTATVSDAGWATYVTPANVEFAENTAFVVTSAGDKINAVSVTQVPAGTPLLLKGEGTKTATVLATTPAAPATNLLEISDGTNGVNDYVLYKDATHEVGFYKWTGAALAAGKVYLPAGVVTTARSFIGFEDATTGISNLNVNENDNFDANAPMYNLAGQRVNKSYKGVVIVNGKKMLNK